MTEPFRAAVQAALEAAERLARHDSETATVPVVCWAAAGLSRELTRVDPGVCPPDALLSRAASVYLSLTAAAAASVPELQLTAPLRLPPRHVTDRTVDAAASPATTDIDVGPEPSPDAPGSLADLHGRLDWARYAYRTNRTLYGAAHDVTIDAADTLIQLLQRRGRHHAELALRRTLVRIHQQRGDEHAAAHAHTELTDRLRALGHREVCDLDGPPRQRRLPATATATDVDAAAPVVTGEGW